MDSRYYVGNNFVGVYISYSLQVRRLPCLPLTSLIYLKFTIIHVAFVSYIFQGNLKYRRRRSRGGALGARALKSLQQTKKYPFYL